MTATAFLDLKQRASKLPENQRQTLSAFLIRLGQERAGWKTDAARRLDAMAAGKKVSVAQLRRQAIIEAEAKCRFRREVLSFTNHVSELRLEDRQHTLRS